MKKTVYIILGFLFVLSCEPFEPVTQDPVNGQQAFGFETGGQSVTVTADGVSATTNVLSLRRANVERSIPVTIDESSTGAASDYQVGSVVIPAGEHFGVLEVNFNNFDGMSDCVTNTLVINLDADSEGTNGPQQYVFTYVKEFECPDLFLNFEFDNYPDETSWIVEDADGTVVAEGDNYDGLASASENICVCPGDYTLTIFDAFEDGICCDWGEGSYELVYNGNVLVSGGEFGASISHDFTID